MPQIPKREDELARPRSRKGGDVQPVTRGELKPVTWDSEPNPDWHEIAQRFYLSAQTSGQTEFWQDSDWATLYFVCDEMDDYLKPQFSQNYKTGELVPKPRSGQRLSALVQLMTPLLMTEGERRRVRMELQEAPETPPDLHVVGIKRYPNVADAE